MEKALVLGAAGQIGTELVAALRARMGQENVIATDLRAEALEEPCFALNAMDEAALRDLVQTHEITQVYHLVAMLSATGEKMPEKAWELNMMTLFHVLNLAKEGLLKRVFWPSSIAAFGPNTPAVDTPQYSPMDPTTVYGISKLAGELWCQYYHDKYGVDVRSIRYPGLISWKTLPGGGTTDYAIDIFHAARREGAYTSFLAANTRLPMMHMEDAIRATLSLMEAPVDQIKIRSSYNVPGVDFTPAELAESMRRHYPDLAMTYAPDFRQAIASSWPQRMDDGKAREDWGWQPSYTLDRMVDDMVAHI
ncbi:MAG: NAD-dependent epimerase/dehydratase family protein [Schleiferiaceae bacterium]